MEDRDVHDLLELFLNVETLRALDVFQVDSAEGGLKQLNRADQLVGVLGVEFNIENIDVSEALEEDAFALHDWLASQRTYVTKTENGRAIGDDCDQVPFCGIFVSIIRVLFNLKTRLSNAWAVSQCEIPARGTRLCRDNFNLALATH